MKIVKTHATIKPQCQWSEPEVFSMNTLPGQAVIIHQ